VRVPGFNQNMLHPQDLRLARRMLRGDEKAISEFMDVYFPRLYRFALVRMNHDESATEDIVQQTLTSAARRIVTYRGEASMMTWLAQICRHELGRYIKQTKARGQVITLFEDDPLASAFLDTLAGDDKDNPLDFSEHEELASLVHRVLDQLPNRHGDVLEWKYIDGLSIREIAERLGMGPEAVQSQLSRAKGTFRRAFGDLYELYCRQD
jgi:RNA polymerase sigma-70 factor, ECF subfamily